MEDSLLHALIAAALGISPVPDRCAGVRHVQREDTEAELQQHVHADGHELQVARGQIGAQGAAHVAAGNLPAAALPALLRGHLCCSESSASL